VNAVAIDCPSIDVGTDSSFTAHNILLPHNILAVENLCNLDRISRSSNNNSSSKFTLIISPLKLGGATGSPARVLALV
jgi:kynurenine formamidase